VGNCIYLVFGTAVTQPWDAEDYLQIKEPELAKGPASFATPKEEFSLKTNENTKENSNATIR